MLFLCTFLEVSDLDYELSSFLRTLHGCNKVHFSKNHLFEQTYINLLTKQSTIKGSPWSFWPLVVKWFSYLNCRQQQCKWKLSLSHERSKDSCITSFGLTVSCLYSGWLMKHQTRDLCWFDWTALCVMALFQVVFISLKLSLWWCYFEHGNQFRSINC